MPIIEPFMRLDVPSQDKFPTDPAEVTSAEQQKIVDDATKKQSDTARDAASKGQANSTAASELAAAKSAYHTAYNNSHYRSRSQDPAVKRAKTAMDAAQTKADQAKKDYDAAVAAKDKAAADLALAQTKLTEITAAEAAAAAENERQHRLGVKQGRHYLRLGRYIPAQEASMMPVVELSRTKTTETTLTAPSVDTDAGWGFWTKWRDNADAAANQANTATDTTKGTSTGSYAGAYLTASDGTTVKNTSSQMQLQSLKSTHVSRKSDGSGILGWTTDDINIKAGGGLSLDIGTAIAMQANTGDITMVAPKGALLASAAEGISLTAGSSGNPANISLVSYGYIKQEAKGPVSDWKYSTSESKTYGWSKDYFYGEKYSEFYGESQSKFYGTDSKWFLGQARSYSLAGKLTCNMSGNLTFNFSGDLTFAMSLSASFALAAQFSMVWPLRITFLKFDLKYADIDFKWVWLDGKEAQFKIENNIAKIDQINGVDLKYGKLNMLSNLIELKSGEITLEKKTVGEVKVNNINVAT